MKIVITLDVMMAKRKMKLNDLATKVNIAPTNLSLLKTGKAKGIRFSTLLAICEALECEPGDIISIEKQ